MGLPQSIFHPQWVFHHRQAVNSAGLARVLIERVTSRGEYNFETGTQEGASTLPLYRGRARIQKVARPTTRDFVEEQAKFQTVRVQVGFEDNELDWPEGVEPWMPNDRVTILNPGSDRDMEGLKLYVWGWLGSSNSWNRTLTCQTNMKQIG